MPINIIIASLINIILAIYYLCKRKREIALKEQLGYQEILLQLVEEINSVKTDHKKLLQRLSDIIFKQLKLKFLLVYSYSNDERKYFLSYQLPQEGSQYLKFLESDLEFIGKLRNYNLPLIIKAKSVLGVKAEVILVPFIIHYQLLGFIVLGPKNNRLKYAQTDIKALRMLGRQIVLALENCFFWEEEHYTQNRLRMQALNNFSSPMAHDLKNPISAVVGLTESLKMKVEDDWSKDVSNDKIIYLKDVLNRIVDNLLRINKQLKAVQEFSQGSEDEFGLLNIGEVVENSLYVIGPQINNKGVALTVEIEPNIWLLGNKIILEKTLVALLSNSLQALELNDVRNKKINIKVYAKNNKDCILIITDNGCGIKEDDLREIFISKSDFLHGLAVVKKNVEEHKGRVWAESLGVGRGSSFFIEIPINR